jgi:protein TonB
MFDRLIVSEPAGTTKGRSRYFALSSFFVGVALASATVISIYAADYGLGTDAFEITALLTPVIETPRTEPAPPRQQSAPLTNRTSDRLPTRQANIQDVRETPVNVPTSVSTTPSSQKSRPVGDFTVSKIDTDPAPGVPGLTRDSGGSSNGPGLLAGGTPSPEKDPVVPEPPPVKPPAPVKPAAPKSLGVINGIAKSLPKPTYPAAAVAANIEGKVDVQVLIDESGRVVSAKAVSGNGMLRMAAEQAARNARFSPTLLSNVPVKVTGVIVYNFNRG